MIPIANPITRNIHHFAQTLSLWITSVTVVGTRIFKVSGTQAPSMKTESPGILTYFIFRCSFLIYTVSPCRLVNTVSFSISLVITSFSVQTVSRAIVAPFWMAISLWRSDRFRCHAGPHEDIKNKRIKRLCNLIILYICGVLYKVFGVLGGDKPKHIKPPRMTCSGAFI